MLSEEDKDLIEKYLDEDLYGEDLVEFEKRIEHLIEIREEIHLHIELRKQLIEFASKEKRKDLKSELSDVLKRQRRNQFIWKVAASVLILSLPSFYFIFFQDSAVSSEEIFNNNFYPYDGYTLVRGFDSQLIDGLATYNEGSFAEASLIFEKLLKNDSSAQLKLLLSSCYLSTNEIDKALILLETIPDTNDQLMLDNRDWYKALCHLKYGRVNESETILYSMLGRNSLFQKQARSLLEQLKDIETFEE